MNDNQKNSWLDRPIVKGLGLSWEQSLYLLILVLCLISRLVMLGYRVESHDESLHCQYSWYLYIGRGYEHNPMMHGPFLFHATALSYFLFGDSDFSARLPIALIGTLLVVFPYLLRRYLGRGGALMASLLLLISPSISYYSRYIRMDIPSLLWAMVIVWAIFGYLDKKQDRYLYILTAALSLLYATKEVAPIYTLIVAVFLVGLFLVRVLSRPWGRRRAELVFVSALGATVLGLLLLAAGLLASGRGEALSLAWWGIAGGGLVALAVLVAVGALLYGLRGQLRSFPTFNLIVVIGTLSLPFASPLFIKLASQLAQAVVNRLPSPDLAPPLWANLANLNLLNYRAPDIYYSGIILAAVLAVAAAIGLLWDLRRWPVAAAIHTAIFLVLFTTVFTNGGGIATGWVGSVGYWLEQQGVKRGGQPWYYYFLALPLYDFLPLLGALVAPIYLGIDSLLRRLRERATVEEEVTLPVDFESSASRVERLFLIFLLVWTLLAWGGYSYAGEKMPWLTVHLTLPMILLTAWFVGQLVSASNWGRIWQSQGWALALLLPALAAALVAVLSAAARGPFQGIELLQLQITATFAIGLAGLIILGLLTILLWRRAGLRNGFLLLGLTVFLILAMLTVRTAYHFSFVNFDHPTEFLVYAHGADGVRTTMEQLEELSLRVAGGPRLIDVTYGPDGSWPFSWYLRDSNYPNARYYPAEPTREQVLATAIIAGREQWTAVEPYLGDEYYTFEYTFLWWPMEDYKQLTWEKLWQWLTDPRKRAALWQIFFYRDYGLYDEITGKTHTLDQWPLRNEFRLYVQKDIANRLWNFRAGPAEEGEAGTSPYAEGWHALAAETVWGTQGSEPGSFDWPRGVDVSDDGFVYVADSRNHRIQKFTAGGEFVTQWGLFGGCPETTPSPGTFCEPWDVAVGPDGAIYVADTWAHRVQKFTADGEFVTQWGSFGQHTVDDPLGVGAFYGPRGIAVGSGGEVYVADTGNKRVQVFTPDGDFLRQWGGGGASLGQLDEPVGLAVARSGEVYVADSWNFRIQVLERDGDPLRSWAIAGWDNTTVEEKPYLALDDAGQVYVTDPGHYRVLVFDSEGNFRYSFGQYGSDDVSFALPMGVAAGPEGTLYVVDAANHRLMAFPTPVE